MSDPAPAPSRLAGHLLPVRFALADLVHDRGLTVFGILLLAALIMPPLLLHSLRIGLIETWAQDLARDIRNREVVIIGENRIAQADLETIAAWPETGFVVPEPSFFVSTQRVRKADSRGVAIDLNLRTTLSNDPVMAGLTEVPPVGSEIVLSARAAEQLEAGVGDRINVILARTPTDGAPVRVSVDLTIRAVLPAERWAGLHGFVAPETLLGFREWLTFGSDDPAVLPPPDAILWQSLRIYAPRVSDAPALRNRLDAFGLETRLMTDQVDRILKLETGLRSVFTMVFGLSTVAFMITAFLLQWLSVMRKTRDFALMTVIGMTRSQISFFPFCQGAVMTAVASLIAVGLVAAVQGPVDAVVQSYLTTPSAVQRPSLLPLVAALGMVMLLGAGAGIAALAQRTSDDFLHALRGD